LKTEKIVIQNIHTYV